MIKSSYVLRLARRYREHVGISEELRGWNWDSPPVEPPVRELGLAISDIAGRYCPSMRDMFVKYVLGFSPRPNMRMLVGRVYHQVMQDCVETVKKFIYENSVVDGHTIYTGVIKELEDRIRNLVERELLLCSDEIDDLFVRKVVERALNLWRFLALKYSSAIDELRSSHKGIGLDSLVSRAIPQVAEYRVDGTRLGLSSNLSVDVFAPTYMVIEYKTGAKKEFHRLATTGYALALESELEVEVNMGVILYIWFDERNLPLISYDYHFIGDELRRRFLDTRDEIMEIIEHARDPGIPPSCYKWCPYLGVCKSEGSKR
ncbi:MAG: type I-A CRISPR-associated protein Cas4/Csa1 [Candidatus Aenigmatarchaeota archaeon]|nr:MAG: type I-A CRISPR-associated protein Cas4/Csa1 [Candidatus Aenigmarchaeota archaeon]